MNSSPQIYVDLTIEDLTSYFGCHKNACTTIVAQGFCLLKKQNEHYSCDTKIDLENYMQISNQIDESTMMKILPHFFMQIDVLIRMVNVINSNRIDLTGSLGWSQRFWYAISTS